MKTIIRNFINVLIRFKVATFLNVAGLAVAFAAFIVILIQINFERTFDRCHPTSGRIFRVDLTIPGTFGTILPRAFVEAVARKNYGLKQAYANGKNASTVAPFFGIHRAG